MTELFMNLTYLQESRACCQAFFSLQTDAWFYFFQLAIFIPWLREQLLWIMYSVSTEFVYSSPGHLGICQLSADKIQLFLFQRQNQSYCKYSTTSEKDQFWEEELNLSLKLNLGKTEVVLSDIPIFSRKHSPFLLVPKPSLWEFSHKTANFKGRMLAYWLNHKIHQKSAIYIQKRNNGSHYSKLCSHRQRLFWWGYP